MSDNIENQEVKRMSKADWEQYMRDQKSMKKIVNQVKTTIYHKGNFAILIKP